MSAAATPPGAAPGGLREDEFEYVRGLVKHHLGLVLEPHKGYFVDLRLSDLVRARGFASASELVAALRRSPQGDLHREVVEAMAVHETYFFRDQHPFEALRRVILPELLERRAQERTLNVWSAACSTGQEPYTLAMTIREALGYDADAWRARILATDYSTKALQRATEGTYNHLEISRGLPSTYRNYFEVAPEGWRVRPSIKSMVEFRQMNLTRPFPALPRMDVVFLRNVLIYFDEATKARVLTQVRDSMKPDGYLFLGSSETLLGLSKDFERIQNGQAVYYRVR